MRCQDMGNEPRLFKSGSTAAGVLHCLVCMYASQSFIIIISSSLIFSSQLPDNVLVEMFFGLVLMLITVKYTRKFYF